MVFGGGVWLAGVCHWWLAVGCGRWGRSGWRLMICIWQVASGGWQVGGGVEGDEWELAGGGWRVEGGE